MAWVNRLVVSGSHRPYLSSVMLIARRWHCFALEKEGMDVFHGLDIRIPDHNAMF